VRESAVSDRTHNVLFLCTGNSARSVLGEAILNRVGAGRFRAYSAGSRPAGRVNPFALELLERRGYRTGDLRSKSWEEFAGADAPAMDIVFTVCDSAARESCPVWPGHPMTVHWGIPDPAAVEGTDAQKRQAFEEAYRVLDDRIRRLVDLPIESLDAATLRRRLREMGESGGQRAGRTGGN
jgi:protein-tyrosine-phosphatase